MASDTQPIRIIFLGTPDFAVASLKALVDNGYHVVAVVTAPDKPAGRGMQVKYSAVKTYANEQGLPVLQPEKLKDPTFLETLRSYRADLQVVVAFRMLPEAVWNMPPMGTVNVHASLLPQYRGAAPINHAIINGETISGVTTFKLQHEIDTGHILLQQALPILPEDNAGSLYLKLMDAGAGLLIQTVEGLKAGTLEGRPQAADTVLHHAPKIFKEDCLIHFEQKAGAVHNLIRGLSPVPAAFTYLGGKTLKIYSSRFELASGLPAPGTPDSNGRTYLRFAAADGWLYALEVQLEGKKRMPVGDFLRGYKL